MPYFIFILIIASIWLITLGASSPKKHSRLWRRLPDEEQSKKMRLRSYLAPILSFSQLILEKLRLEERTRKTLTNSHVKLLPSELFTLKVLLMLLFGLLVIVTLGKAQIIFIVAALALGYLIPDFWLYRKITQRKYTIARLLPEAVDLLSLCIEAGLDFTTSIKWIIDKTRSNPMVEELGFVLEEIKWGKPRTQALRDMAKRLNIAEVSSFVQTLVQAERMGTPVAEAFTILSEDTRLRRFHSGERIAMQAPIKILLPLIFFILPVIAIIIGGPIFLQFTQGGMLQGLGR